MILQNIETLMRNSNPDAKTDKRIQDIVSYLKVWNLRHVVLGVSGGIDSAFVLMLLNKARERFDFNIHTVFFRHSLHEHEASQDVVDEFVRAYPVNHSVIDISGIVETTQIQDGCIDAIVDTQYAYALMYTLLFRQAQKVGGVTFGTTNKDELGIGWFGKNSDMVVDIQPIHDFHKFEIYSSYLCQHIPISIKDSAPDGNLINGQTDEDVFGCPYDVVSSVVDLLEKGKITKDQVSEFPKLFEVIRKNQHKLAKPRHQFNPVFLGHEQ